MMGIRFRKGITIFPGLKLTIGKKSFGISTGGKIFGLSFNSKTGSRARTSIPGTGLSYSRKLGSGKNNRKGKAWKAWMLCLSVAMCVLICSACGEDSGNQHTQPPQTEAPIHTETPSTPSPTPSSTPSPVPQDTEETEAQVENYVLNNSSMKFHQVTCDSVEKIKESNKQEYTGTREELIQRGYEPCGICHP